MKCTVCGLTVSLLLFLTTTLLNGQALSGNKTVGGTSPDYDNLTAAVTALTDNGISGPVTFNIRTGTYDEQISIPAISGAGPNDTIRFQSESGNREDVTLRHTASGSGDNYVIMLNGADYVIVQNITILAMGATYGTGISLDNGANWNIFRNNRVSSVITTSNSDNLSVIFSDYGTPNNNGNVYLGNTIENGSVGINCEGYSTRTTGTIIRDNVLTNQYRRGIECNNQESLLLSGNYLESSAGNPYYYGIAVFTTNNSQVKNNNIQRSNNYGGYGLYFNNCNGAGELSVANNFIRIHAVSSNQIGMKSDGCSDVNYYYNSVNLTGSTSDGKAFHIVNTHSNTEIKNSILSNKAGGYAFYIESASFGVADYNDLYATGILKSFWSLEYSGLTNWSTGTGMDQHSISADPLFWSDSDLHAANTALQSGTDLSSVVNDDFDSESRDPVSPCMGADEFVYPALGGNYSIGSGEDFENFTEAVQALIDGGVRDSVIFSVEPGTYTEHIIIPEINNSSQTNYVVFTSATGDSSSVILTYTPPDNPNDYTIRLDGADNLVFRHLTIRSQGTQYATVIELLDGPENIAISNCRIIGSSSPSLIEGVLVDGAGSWTGNSYRFINNRLEEGTYGLYFQGPSGGESTDYTIRRNTFLDQDATGIQLRRIDAATVEDNLISTQTTDLFYGLWLFYCDGSFLVNRNRIYATGSSQSYGIYMYDSHASSGNEGVISNNHIATNVSGTIGYGVLAWNSTYQIIANNTVELTGTQPVSRTFFIRSGCSDISSLNNIFINSAGGYSIYSEITSGIVSNYNNLYTNGAYLGNWSGTDQSSLSNWQSASGQDGNSLPFDPQLSAADDPHFPNPLLNDAGTPITEVTTDIDGEIRDAVSPDIGADEFCLPPVTADKYGCTGRSIPDLTATGSNIRWYSDEALTAHVHSGSNFSTGHTSVGSYTYYATQTVNESESQSSAASLTIYTTPGLPATSDETICFGESTPDLTATGTNIKWYSDEALLDSVYAGLSFPTGETDAGTYIYYVSQTTNGCESDAETSTLVINPIPSAPDPMNAVVCEEETLPPLTASGSNIRWYDDEGLTNQVHTGGTFNTGHTEPGDYPYFATQTLLGCESPAAYDTARINALPPPPLVWDKDICYGEATPLMEASGTGITWYSDPGLSTIITDTDSTFTPGQTAIGRYPFYATQTVMGCEGSPSTAYFSIHTLPVATVMDDAVICQADTQYFNIGSAPLAGHSYSWESDIDGFIGTDADPAVKPLVTTSYTLIETIDSTGCQDIDGVTITVNIDPSISVLADQELCESDIHSFLIGEWAEIGHSYSWTSDPPGFSSIESNPEITPPGSITYIITKTSGTTGCYSMDSVVFTIHPDPAAGVIADQSICQNDVQPVSIGADQVAGSAYEWSSSPAGFTSYEANPVVTPGSTTMYILTETVIATGCSNTDSVTLTLNPNPSVSVLGDQEFCESDNHAFNIGETAEGGHSYSWTSDPAGFTYSEADPEITPPGSIIYILTKIVTATGCGIVDSVEFVIHPNPEAKVLDDQTICRSEIQAFDLGANPVAGHTYDWISDRGDFSSDISNPSDTPDSTTTYTLTETNTVTGCEATNALTITINPDPEFTLEADDNPVDQGTGTSLTASDQSLNYVWDPGTGLSSTSGYLVTATPDENITYHVTGINQYNCEANASVDLMVYCPPCGESEVLVDTGNFSYGCSVNNLYKNDLNCSWTLYPDDISKIYLYFYPVDFDVRPGDWVIVYNGTQASEDTLGKFNNDHPPSGNIEGGNSVFIEFITDGSDSGSGFQARWSGSPTNQVINLNGSDLKIYPNPAKDILYIEWMSKESEDAQIRIYNNLGQLVRSREIPVHTGPMREEFSLQGLEKGLYHIYFNTSGKLERKKIVKE